MEYRKNTGISQETREEISKLIINLLGLEQTYIQLAYLCFSDRVNLINFGEYYRQKSIGGRMLAQKLQHFLNVNGFTFKYDNPIETLISVPEKEQIFQQVPFKALIQIAINGEKIIQDKIHGVLSVAKRVNDFPVVQWMEGRLLLKQECVINELVGHLNGIEMGEQNKEFNHWTYDRMTMSEIVGTIYKQVIIYKPETWYNKCLNVECHCPKQQNRLEHFKY